MGDIIKNYLSDKRGVFKLITLFFLSIIFVTISLDITGCSKNTENRQNNNKNAPPKITKVNLNCKGYIDDVYNKNGSNYFSIDTVEWLSGKAAVKAFNMDKKAGKNLVSTLTNGYYIRNLKIDSLKFKISDTAKVVMQTLSYNNMGNYNFNEKIQISRFLKLLNNKEYKRLKFKLYKFQIINNEITSIEEIYLP
jgi:hypothetical protein